MSENKTNTHTLENTEDQATSEVKSSVNDNPLPQPLEALRFQQRVVAIVAAFLSFAFSIFFKQLQPLTLLLLSLYFFWMAWFVEYNWKKGRILQNVVMCSQVIKRARTTQIVCRTEDRVYSYMIPNRKSVFTEGHMYIVWVNEANPKAIMAFLPI